MTQLMTLALSALRPTPKLSFLASAARATLTRGPSERPDSQTHQGYQASYERFRASYRAARLG